MSKLIALLAVTTVCFIGGCKSDSSSNEVKTTKSSATTKMAAVDACSHCDGVQVATAQGTCPICGRKAAR